MASPENNKVIHQHRQQHPGLELVHHSGGTLPAASCFVCSQPIVGNSYQCKPCGFYLDFSCAQLDLQFQHPAHPNHVLKLSTRPVYSQGRFRCNACGDIGNSLCYYCRECHFDLHVECAMAPTLANHDGHHHPLDLIFQNPSLNKEYRCDVCGIRLSNLWRYRCNMCDFDAHLGCVKNGGLQYDDSRGTTARTTILNGASGNQRGLARGVGSALIRGAVKRLVGEIAEDGGSEIIGSLINTFFGSN